MLTRTQVARRLGRSLATVRRAEGKTLHPTVDGRGTHRFDPVEVDALAERLLETGTFEGLDQAPGPGNANPYLPRNEDGAREVNELRARIEELEIAVRTSQRELKLYQRHVEEVIKQVSDAAVQFAPELDSLMRAARRELGV